MAAAGRGNYLGNDTFDTIGSGLATAMALPGAIGKARAAGGSMEGKSLLDAGFQLAPDVYNDIKGTVDYKADEFAKTEDPELLKKLGYVGDVAQAYGAVKWAGLPLAKSAWGMTGKPILEAGKKAAHGGLEDIIKLIRSAK